MSEPEFVEKADPEDVFAALSDDTRVAVLRALWEADDEEMSFSQLREAVGIRDSGQFNYHLGKLVDRFVARTEEGYELTQAGIRINGAIDAGSYTLGGTVDPIPLTGGCPTCGGDRTLYYEDELVRVDCDSCFVTAEFGVPPSVVAGCDREEIPDVAGQYLRAKFRWINGGFCSYCDGRLEPSVSPIADSVGDPPDEMGDEVAEQVEKLPFVSYDCERCGSTAMGGLRLAFLDHPAIAGFYHGHGIDARDLPVWDFAGFDPDRESIRSSEPFRARVTYSVDDDARTLIVDDALDVVAIESGTGTGH
jgi:DNA-binding transcriptional ArsR family regulator